MTRQIKITLNSSGEGTISAEDLGEFPCLGDPETLYPTSVSNGGKEGEEKFPELYSNVLDANIEQAVLLGWEYGLFIHAGADNLAHNGGPTGGNIQLSGRNSRGGESDTVNRMRMHERPDHGGAVHDLGGLG